MNRDCEDSWLPPSHGFSVGNSLGSMICAVCVPALTEGLPVCNFVYSCFHKEQVVLTSSQGVVPMQCAGVCMHMCTHIRVPFPPLQIAEYQACPRLPHGDVSQLHITRNFYFFHHVVMTEAAMSCRQLFVGCCSHGTALEAPLTKLW